MNNLDFSRLPRKLALLALLLWVTAAQAQTAPTAPAPTQKAPVTQATAPAFQSAFEGYKPYTDEKILNWKEANDVVGRIGGWRAYAKEAAQAAPDAQAEHGKPAQAKP